MSTLVNKTPVLPTLIRNMSNKRTSRNPCLDRQWIPASDGAQIVNDKFNNNCAFRVASYNVLCQNLMASHPDLYRSCDPQYLDWGYRSETFLREIKCFLPDILCLQEVNCTKFHTFYKPSLAKLGYEGLFIKRSGNKTDGCSTFFNSSKFMLDKHLCQGIYYSPANDKSLLRDNVAEIVALIPRFNTDIRLLVSNTHLLFNPKRGDIKLWQCMRLLAELQNTKKSTFNTSHVIMCGDFNMFPRSPLYDFLRNKRKDFQHYAKTQISGQIKDRRSFDNSLGNNVIPHGLNVDRNCEIMLKDSDPNVNYNNGVVQHSLNLESAYDHSNTDPDTKGVTTHHDDVNATVDFIFYEKPTPVSPPMDDAAPRLHLTYVLQSLTAKQMMELGSMPSEHFSSDHTMICAEFVYQ